MSKRFIALWIGFWALITVLIVLYFPRQAEPEHEVVCVGLNQRAWTIALELFPGDDPRVIVAQMEMLNPGKDITILKPGELIKIPAR